jgi:hypothetical protein
MIVRGVFSHIQPTKTKILQKFSYLSVSDINLLFSTKHSVWYVNNNIATKYVVRYLLFS